MKKIWMIVAGIMLGTVLTYGQDIAESQVPSVVLNNFKKEFPKASDVEWEQKGSDYKVDFEIRFTDHEVRYDEAGRLVKHTEDIRVNELPNEIQSVIKKEHAGYKASDAKKIIQQEEVTYEVEIEKGETEFKIIFSSTGTELNRTES